MIFKGGKLDDGLLPAGDDPVFLCVHSHSSSAHKNQKHDDLTALKRMIITVVTVEGETTWGSLDSFALLSAASKTPAKKRVRRSETALETARRTF